MIAAISGGAGDTVYAIPTMKQLGVTKLYVKDSKYETKYGDQHRFLKRFIEHVGIQCLPTDCHYPFFEYDPKLKFDIDLDQSRKQPQRGRVHIMKSFAKQFRTQMPDIHSPWLHIHESFATKLKNFVLVAVTPRWRDNSKVNWNKVIKHIEKNESKEIYFIGFEDDYKDFCNRYKRIKYLPTYDLLDIACHIRDCDVLYSNQNVCLPIAQGLCKAHYLEAKPGRTNTILLQKNEYLLDHKFY